jgi:HPt (histidine-containing phosphotransfer) domain-containing protein
MKTYDLNLLREQCGNDKSFYNEMIRIFISSTKEGIDEIEKALKNKDMMAVSHQAHKIISPCRHINASNMVRMLASVENIARGKEGKEEDLPELAEKIKFEFNTISGELSKEIS